MRLARLLVVALAVMGVFGASARGQNVCSFTQPQDESGVCGLGVAFVMSLSWTTTTGYQETYEYRAQGAGAWTLLQQYAVPPGASPYHGTAYTWTFPAGIAEGRYYVRATLTTASGTVSDVRSVYVVRNQAAINWVSPANGAVVRGMVAVRGETTLGYGSPTVTMSYQGPSGGSFVAIPAGTAQPGEIGRWNTVGLTDGTYQLRVSATDGCGANVASVTRTVVVDNTAPDVAFLSPGTCQTRSQFTVTGRATDAHMDTYQLELPDASGNWAWVSQGHVSVTAQGMGIYLTLPHVPTCIYLARLVAWDTAQDMNGEPNRTERYLTLDARCPGDFNKSGSVEVQDIFDFLNAWFAACP